MGRSGFRLLVPRRGGNYGNWKLNDFSVLRGAKFYVSGPVKEEKTGNCLQEKLEAIEKPNSFQFPCHVSRKAETALQKTQNYALRTPFR